MTHRQINSPARDALVAAGADIATARDAVAAAEATVERLKTIAGAPAEAERAVLTLIETDGGDGLARFAGGEAESAIERAIASSEAARRTAAAAAAAALPGAERALADAQERLVAAEDRKRRQVAAVLLQHADALGREYRAAFDVVAGLHDRLAGLARGIASAGGPDIALATQPFEIPRFNLPSLPPGDVYSTYMRHAPHAPTVAGTALACRRAAARLAEDGTADIADLFSSEAVAAEGETERRPGEGRASPRLAIQRRERREPAVDEVLYRVAG